MSKRLHPLNKVVGARVRERRILLGLSQRQLADAVGLTFQQIQKYENGTNRIDVARLAALAYALERPPEWFFRQAIAEAPVQFPVFRTEISIEDEMGSREALTLIRGFNRICDPIARQGLLNLVQAISEASNAGPIRDLDDGPPIC